MSEVPRKIGAARILLVEDDRSLREGLVLSLSRKGFHVFAVASGDDGLREVFEASYNLVILDLMLPGCSGLDILFEMREGGINTPVLILSALGKTDQKVEGLRLGADDYLAKPFDLAELFARVGALLRRSQAETCLSHSWDRIKVLLDEQVVLRDGQALAFSSREFKLLRLLLEASGKVLSRDMILRRVWGWDFEGTPRTVDNYIMAIRRHLEDDPARPQYLITVHGQGYRLQVPAPKSGQQAEFQEG